MPNPYPPDTADVWANPPPAHPADLERLRVLGLLLESRRQLQGGLIVEATLAQRQVRKVFEGAEAQYPPIMSYEQAAALVQVSLSTFKGWLSQGRFASCVKRGKPGRVLRDEFVRAFMRDEFGINE